jgi:DNA-directed RNA polymerase delta subunit
MPKISKQIVDKDLRERVFKDAIYDDNDEVIWQKINDRQYGCILTDLNGEQRYVRIGAIVAELRDDMTAEELMQSEIDAYNTKQNEKEAKRAKNAAKAEADKAKREKEREDK